MKENGLVKPCIATWFGSSTRIVPGRFSLPWLTKRAPMKSPYSGHE